MQLAAWIAQSAVGVLTVKEAEEIINQAAGKIWREVSSNSVRKN